jgi:hypothetical protein
LESNGKSKKVFIGFIVVVVLAIVVGFLVYGSQKPGVSTGEGNGVSSSDSEKSLAMTDEEITQVVRQALDDRDSSLCEKIGREDAKENCLSNVIITKASDAKDPSICNELEDEYSRTACKDNIIIVRARDTKNPSLCGTMTDRTRIEQCRATAR